MAPRDIIIKDTHRGLWYEDGKLTKVLEAGRYEIPASRRWFRRRPIVECVLVDVRERDLTIKGQEILTADKVAATLGIEKTAAIRARAGVAYALGQMADDGHVYAPQEELVTEAAQLLEVDPAIVPPAIEALDAEARSGPAADAPLPSGSTERSDQRASPPGPPGT